MNNWCPSVKCFNISIEHANVVFFAKLNHPNQVVNISGSISSSVSWLMLIESKIYVELGTLVTSLTISSLSKISKESSIMAIMRYQYIVDISGF